MTANRIVFLFMRTTSASRGLLVAKTAQTCARGVPSAWVGEMCSLVVAKRSLAPHPVFRIEGTRSELAGCRVC